MEKVRTAAISWYGHEGKPTTLDLQADMKEILNHGFNRMVIPVSEATLLDPLACERVKEMVDHAHKNGIACEADPWGMGLFGGEGEFPSKERIGIACTCNNEYIVLVNHWLRTVKEFGFDGVFWDEPSIDPKHRDAFLHDEVAVIREFSTKAGLLGLDSSVCLPADAKPESSVLEHCKELAALPYVKNIGVDPYWPNAFMKIPREARLGYVAFWAKNVKQIADSFGKEAHVWMQAFEIIKGDVGMIDDIFQVLLDCGIQDIRVWSFLGQKNLVDRNPNEVPQQAWRKYRRIFSS